METRYEECINAWLFQDFCKARRGHCSTTILYFHGNSGNISHRHYVIDICRRFNLNLLLVDYRGYGRSDGTCSATGIYQDGEAAYHFLTGQVDCDNIIIWGESLGGTVACHVASKYKCRALILLATFSSLDDVIDDIIEPRILARGISWTVNGLFHPMNSKFYLKNINCPVAIMHSQCDTLIPYRCSKILYDAIPHNYKVLYTIEGDHSSPKITDDTLKQMFAFVGIQAECMDHHLSYVIDTLADVTKDNPGLMPNDSFFSVSI
jgi:pimeloyl-ACP methyl ester carboxylesterase